LGDETFVVHDEDEINVNAETFGLPGFCGISAGVTKVAPS
jgi:hypothetical protein